jgi:hypothetical protein
MRPRWLLLGVSVLCLLMLFPAAALSQGGTEIACGSAVVDGTVRTAEWADGTKLPMTGYYQEDNLEEAASARGAGRIGQVEPTQNGQETEGWLYLKNDDRYLYVGMTMDIGEEHESYWGTYMEVAFTDEPCGSPAAWVDDKWAAANCDDSPGEGTFWATEGRDPSHYTKGPNFVPGSDGDYWCEEDTETAQGVVAKASRHTAHYEMRIDLTSSRLNCVAPGDCFRLFAFQDEWFCPPGDPGCQYGPPTQGWVSWPGDMYYGDYPGDFGTICLNPCEVEFVPEPGSILLLGSGLMGLAGYATLRWRRE